LADDTTRGARPDPRDLVPQQKGAREVRVGAFVLAGALAFLLLLYQLTDPATFRGRYKVTTRVESALGLRKGDPVLMRGVNIGRVHDFGILPDETAVDIVLEIEGRWVVPSDSKTRLVTASLLGGKAVEVVPGSSPIPVAEGGRLEGLIVRSILDDTDALGEKADDLIQRFQALLSEENVGALGASARQLETLLTDLAEVTNSRKDELESMIDRLAEASAGLADLAGASPELREDLLATAASADTMMARMREASERLAGASRSLEVVLARMERGEGTLGQLSVNDTLYVTLTAALDNAASLLADLRANPGRYINISIF